MTKKQLSIYVHIPFCLSKCKYCSFYSEILDSELISRYFKALKNTSSYFSTLIDKENTIIETVYFGGGTPTTVGSENLCDLLNHFKKIFKLSENCEITIEANPKTITLDSAKILLQNGFNRVSLGVQTTSNNRLNTLGRIHSFKDAQNAYQILKEAGFDNISLDLMYALPNTSLNDVLEDLENILNLSPRHISTYALSLEKGTPLYSEKEKFTFPDDDLQLEMYLEICSKLSENGYSHYEISNFSQVGFESKHNLGYWERHEYIGFGSGAHSYWDNKRFYAEDNKDTFIHASENSDFLTALGLNNAEEISEYEKKEEEIMLAIRTSKGLYIPSLSSKLNKLVKDGFANYKDGIFSLTDKGFFVSNHIIYYLCKELLYDKE